jgi:hypothetical protein
LIRKKQRKEELSEVQAQAKGYARDFKCSLDDSRQENIEKLKRFHASRQSELQLQKEEFNRSYNQSKTNIFVGNKDSWLRTKNSTSGMRGAVRDMKNGKRDGRISMYEDSIAIHESHIISKYKSINRLKSLEQKAIVELRTCENTHMEAVKSLQKVIKKNTLGDNNPFTKQPIGILSLSPSESAFENCHQMVTKGLSNARVRKSNDNSMVDSANVFGGSRTHKLLRNEGLSRSSHSQTEKRGEAKGQTPINWKDK